MSEPETRDEEERVVLVDEEDNVLGSAEKLSAHQNGGQLHRAFSVFVFNRHGQLLLQRRASVKYHFSGLWSNTCCGHPREGESIEEEARRRLLAEMGFTSSLSKAFCFVYQATDPATGLTEHELDHVFVGSFDGDPTPDPAEAEAWAWVGTDELEEKLASNPSAYTPWFPIALAKLLEPGP